MRDRKVQLVVLPYAVLQGKTYPRPLCIAPAGALTAAAVPITVTVASAPAGVLIEAQALTPVHEYWEAVVEHLTANVIATAR